MEWLSIRKTLSYSDVEQVETELKVKLPNDYKHIIGSINGGALKNAYINHPVLGEIAYSRNVSLNKEAKANIKAQIKEQKVVDKEAEKRIAEQEKQATLSQAEKERSDAESKAKEAFEQKVKEAMAKKQEEKA